jgi:hypothetical protein
MATPIPNYYADTSINGEVIGEQEIRLFPLVNSVISSEPLILTVNKVPTAISNSYLLTYDNGELGPTFNKDNIKRNEIYDLNNHNRYRYLVQDSSGSNYPTGSAIESTPTASLLPSNYSGLQLWLDANDTTTVTTSSGTNTVTAWSNKSSVSKTITLGGSPKLITGSLNSKSGVRFTTSDYLRETTNYSAPVTVMYVGKLTGGANSRFITAISNNWLLGAHGGTINDGYFEGWVYDSGTGADTTPRLWSATIGGSGINSTVYSGTSSLASNQNGVTGPNGISINQSPYGEYSNCELYELLIYNKVISSTERDNLFTYFYNKWGVAAAVGPGYIGYTVGISGSSYLNSNFINIRFISGSLSGSNLSYLTFNISASVTSSFITASQDILVTNITKSVDNGYLNNLTSGSNLIKGTDGIVNKTIYTGDLYFSDTSINTEGLIKRTILRGSNTTITTNTSEFIPTVNKTYTYEVDYNYMFNQEIDSVLTIDTAYDLPTGFNISTNGKNIVGYVNFTDTKTVIVKLSDGTIYNIIIKPIFFKKKYIY